jgi:hypothetical protein
MNEPRQNEDAGHALLRVAVFGDSDGDVVQLRGGVILTREQRDQLDRIEQKLDWLHEIVTTVVDNTSGTTTPWPDYPIDVPESGEHNHGA